MLLFFAAASHAAPAKAEKTLEELFRERSWGAMSKLYASLSSPKPKEHALMANAMRIQNKWAEAVVIIEKNSASFPESIRPYADMTLLLGYEKLNRNKEALKISERLWSSAPKELKYYIASAQLRLLKDAEPLKKQAALNRMLQTADTKERRIYVLSRIISLPGDRNSQALELLGLQAGNKAAATILFKHKKPWPIPVKIALGVYAHTVKDDASAINYLASIPLNTANGRKAAYYRAWSLFRKQRSSEALELWSYLALNGNSWSEASVRRIGTMAEKPGAEKEKSIEVLKQTVEKRSGKVQARAMLLLSKYLDEKEKVKLEDNLIQAHPDTVYAFKVLWKRGWSCFDSKDFTGSIYWWEKAYAPSIDSYRKARILYWLAYAQKAAGQTQESGKTLKTLARNHPLSIYTFMSSPEAIKILPGGDPSLKSSPIELEHWGFIVYARLKLSRPGASVKELYRSLELSRWLGLAETYQQARLLTGMFTSGTTMYRNDLEALYPRPFKKYVDDSCKAYNIENNFMWSIMRQESAFKPQATSWVGASGLMQLMPATAKGEAKRIGLKKYDIYNIKDNILMGASHIAWLKKSFAREDWIMAAYNAGSGNARKWLAEGRDSMAPDRWIEEVRFDETCDYVQKVSGNLAVYRMLYDAETTSGDDVSVQNSEEDSEGEDDEKEENAE